MAFVRNFRRIFMSAKKDFAQTLLDIFIFAFQKEISQDTTTFNFSSK
jgi:hypothetical protein